MMRVGTWCWVQVLVTYQITSLGMVLLCVCECVCVEYTNYTGASIAYRQVGRCTDRGVVVVPVITTSLLR